MLIIDCLCITQKAHHPIPLKNFFFGDKSYYVAQGGLKLVESSNTPSSATQEARISGMHTMFSAQGINLRFHT
jgi:hypothetical protein